MYDTLCDVAILAEAMPVGHAAGPGVKLNASFLREHMHVTDLSDMTGESDLMREARARGCKIVEPHDIFVDYLATTFKAITGKEFAG